MRLRTTLIAATALLAATLLGVFLIDRPLAASLAASPLATVGAQVTGALQLLFAFEVLDTHLYFLLIVGAALALTAYDRRLQRAWPLYFVAATQAATRQAVTLLKDVFERVRPYDWLAGHHGGADFFVAGNHSFPSGHGAFYFGLLLPAALVLPRWRYPLLGLASLGALARVLEGKHYLADVLASALVALIIAAVLMKLMRVQPVAAPFGSKP